MPDPNHEDPVRQQYIRLRTIRDASVANPGAVKSAELLFGKKKAKMLHALAFPDKIPEPLGQIDVSVVKEARLLPGDQTQQILRAILFLLPEKNLFPLAEDVVDEIEKSKAKK